MKYYFDESGSFRVPTDRREHAVGIVVGVVVPETQEDDIWKRFRAFIATLPSSAFKNREPKGHLLDGDARRAFATFVAETDGILICPQILDLTSMAGQGEELKDRIIKKLELVTSQCKYDTMKDEVTVLRRQAGNMSPEVAFRLGAWAMCISRGISDSIIRFSTSVFHDCWSNVAFEIDPVQQKAGSREEQVFSTMLPSWIAAWSHNRPFTLIDEIHTADHPFVKNWDSADGIDLGKMFRGNVRYCSSHQSLGVQIADMAASIVAKAVVGVVTTPDLVNYGLMMNRAIGQPTHMHGIFSFAPTDSNDIGRRYHGLVEVVLQSRSRFAPSSRLDSQATRQD